MQSFLASRFELPDYSGRIVPFEGLRGFAALIVFFVHFRALFGDGAPAGSFLYKATSFAGAFGHTGVDIFFVLSGYLIYGIVIRERFRYGPYLLRRFGRLYPTFLVVFGLYLALSAIFPDQSKLPAQPIPALVYILANLAMLPGIVNIVPMITPAWSLSYELLFYVTLPLIVAGLGMRGWRGWHRLTFFLFLAVLGETLSVFGLAGHVRLIMFATGIILWEVSRDFSPAGKLNFWGEGASILAFCGTLAIIGITYSKVGPMTPMLTRVPGFYSATLFVSVFFLALHAVFFDGVLRRIFSWSYLRWIGNMSYSYYLVHGLALHGVQTVLNSWFSWLPRNDFTFLAIFAVSVAATLVCAALLYLGIEKPFSLQPRAARQAVERQPIPAGDAR